MNLTPGELLSRQLKGDASVSNEDIENATVDYFKERGVNCKIIEKPAKSKDVEPHDIIK